MWPKTDVEFENYLTVSCPYCFAKIGDYCKTKLGKTAVCEIHSRRIKKFNKLNFESNKLNSNFSPTTRKPSIKERN